MLEISTNILRDSKKLNWNVTESNASLPKIEISICLDDKYTNKEALRILKEVFSNDIEWLYNRSGTWYIDLDRLRDSDIINKRKFQYLFVDSPIDNERSELKYLRGIIDIDIDIQLVNDGGYDGGTDNTIIIISLDETEIMEKLSKKIFLSHKGEDKERVKLYNETLKNIGFDTWLDIDAMVAGTELNRGILQGFKEACAAIFFITSNYKDDKFLATEINYAITEKREKKDKFRIITIVLPGHENNFTIPDLLKEYVWKMPKTDLEALQDIIKALPITLGKPTFK